MSIFKREVVVSTHDLDELNHVNNVRYLQWVQDVAEAHWKSKASAVMQSENIWVVLRHEIDYRGGVGLGEEILIKTWVGRSEGVKSDRHVEFSNSSGKIIAKAITTWCLLDAKTRKPKRVVGVVDIFL